MTQYLRWPIALATFLGLAAGVWAIGSVGLTALARAALHIGVGGFLAYIAASLALYMALGAAWWAAMPGQRVGELPLFGWARIVREGANDLLPFSQIGGLVVGGRTLTMAGLAAARVYAALVVDLSTEMVSQVVFTLAGVTTLGSLLVDEHRTRVAPLAWIGVAVSIAITIAFILLQRPMLKLAAKLARKLVPDGAWSMNQLNAHLADIYARRGAVALSFAINLGCWVYSAALAAMVLAMIGTPMPLWRVIALESLIFAIRGAAFVIPGGIGVQEAGYMLLGPLIGLDPQAAVALSLVKRARDVAIGVPALLIWQAREIGGRHANA